MICSRQTFSRRMRSGPLVLMVWVCFASLLSGCNSGPKVAPVSGKATLDGKPLKFGTVMFQQATGGQPAVGEIQSDGSFQLSTFRQGDGAIVGTHLIRVACYSSQDPASGLKGGDSLGNLMIPVKYTVLTSSGLTAEVPGEGLESFVIELKSDRPAR